MAVLIDPPRWPAYGRLWSHLVSDASLEELHTFARRAEIPSRGFEGDHYDVPADACARMIDLGAQPVGSKELLHRLVASGLRTPKRRGEKVIYSRWYEWLPGSGTQRVDVVLSSLPVPAEATIGGWLLLTDRRERLLLTASVGHDWDLPPESLQHNESSARVAVHTRVGYVRGWLNRTPPAGYPYPSPWTFSPVWRAELTAEAARRAVEEDHARWCDIEQARQLIGHHAAWPLVERVLVGQT